MGAWHTPNVCTVVAYAANNENAPTRIADGIKVELPFGTIRRDKLNAYEENGKLVTRYDTGFSNGNINVIGSNIKSVTYSCVNEELYYHDDVMKNQMQKNGQLEVCEFIVKKSLIPYADAQVFKRLWNEGYFEDIKQQYFKNRSANINEYRIVFEQKGDQISREEWTVHIEHDYKGKYPFEQRGKTVTVQYYKQRGDKSLAVSWCPWKALDLASQYRPLRFSQLPGDTITITVSFINGQTTTRVLHLSYDDSGKLFAQMED
jgi:hypothetical protein